MARLKKGEVSLERFEAAAVGIAPPKAGALAVDGPAASARILREVLAGEPGPAREIVLLNASAAAQAAGVTSSWKEGIACAVAAIDGGKAQAALEKLVEVSNAT